jgi:hypothetical protein
MVTRKTVPWFRRRETYLVAGVVMGIIVMAMPAIIHVVLGPQSPFRDYNGTPYLPTEPSLFELVAEIVWLILPALIILFFLYWIVTRRTRWAGYEEAVKWIRR